MWSTLLDIAHDCLDLVYPRICVGCDINTPVRNGMFCMHCLADIPVTGFHNVGDNRFEQQFWGRVPISSGAAKYFFIPGGITQNLLHNIKYRGRKDVATTIGRQYGRELIGCRRFESLTMIVPVPLHWRKLRKRGYNQSQAFGAGISDALQLPLHTNLLYRSKSATSLTSMTREERLNTISSMFSLKACRSLAGHHVLLVDDVLTTGATLEACASRLLSKGALVSLATIACGRI